MRNGLTSLFWDIFFTHSRAKAKYKRITESGRADMSKSFGIGSIILSILTVGAALLAYLGITMMGSDNFLAVILGIFVIIAGALSVLALFVSSLVKTIYQFRLNRGAVSWIALIFLILSLIFPIILIILLNKG